MLPLSAYEVDSSLFVSERICAVNAASDAESAVSFYFHFSELIKRFTA